MAKIFLDTNIFIDCVEGRRSGFAVKENLEGHRVYISPLSIHILLYIAKQKIPYATLSYLFSFFSIVEFDRVICYRVLNGPTDDFEDNVQLHSAAEADCDFFLTEDKKLLHLTFFGKTRLVKTLK